MGRTSAQEIVFISGNFNVLHAGHIRLFAFARKFGAKLVVGVISDRLAGGLAYVRESDRLEAVQTNNWVSESVLVDEPIEDLLLKLRPKVVIKGREFEQAENVEAAVVSMWGGRIIFGASELPLSSIEMMRRELADSAPTRFSLPRDFLRRHQITRETLITTAEKFQGLNVCVVGDLIIDEYISCESLGMSQEDPSLVVTPIDSRRFLGGAGIVAAHASALGAKASLVSVKGDDETGEFATKILGQYGVHMLPVVDDSRPTTLKQRYRSEGKTLLRVSHLAQTSINPELQEKVFEIYADCIEGADLIVFSDFNYGCLPNRLIPRLTGIAEQRGTVCVADSQCSSQIGDISRFKNMSLISATEREVRVSLRDSDDGLTVIAERLRKKANAEFVMVKLGAEGVLVHTQAADGRTITNQIPALNQSPVDVAGAGDSMLITAGLTLAAKGSVWDASVLGSLASGLQVARIGNQPISQRELLNSLASCV